MSILYEIRICEIYYTSSEMAKAFDAFKKETLQRKKAVKGKSASPKEFMDWLYQQSIVIVELADY